MHLRNRNYYDGSRIRIECTSYDVLLTSSSSCAHPVGGGGHLNVHREDEHGPFVKICSPGWPGHHMKGRQ